MNVIFIFYLFFFNSDLLSAYQKHRLGFVPITPNALKECTSKKMVLKESSYPIDEGLQPLFPTLIDKGMKYLELSQDGSGAVEQSSVPLRLGCVLSGG